MDKKLLSKSFKKATRGSITKTLENTKGFINKNKTDFPKKPKKGKRKVRDQKTRHTMTMRCFRSGKLTKEFASIPIRVRCNKKKLEYGNTTKEANAGAKK
jgi:hypothetical protein